MFKPNETANDLFRRLNNEVFELRLNQDRIEKIQFGSAIEVQAHCSEMTEVRLHKAYEHMFLLIVILSTLLF